MDIFMKVVYTDKQLYGEDGLHFAHIGDVWDVRMYAWQMSHFSEHYAKTKTAIDNFGK